MAVLTIICWFLHVPDLQPPSLVFPPTCLVTSSEAAKQAPSPWWHVHYIGHMADWLHAEGDNRSQAARHCYCSRWGKRGIQYLDRCHLLSPPVWSWTLYRTHCLPNDEGTKGTFRKHSRAVFTEHAQGNCWPQQWMQSAAGQSGWYNYSGAGTATFYSLVGCLPLWWLWAKSRTLDLVMNAWRHPIFSNESPHSFLVKILKTRAIPSLRCMVLANSAFHFLL